MASVPNQDAVLGSLDRLLVHVRSYFKPRLSALGERISPLQLWETHRADVVIVSFPKTGRTWVRMMLHTVFTHMTGVKAQDPLEFHEFSRADGRIPRIRMYHEDEPHWKHPRQMRRSKSHLRDKKVILLVRDPRDTMVSLYFQVSKRWRATTKSIEEFIWQSRGGLDAMIEYYNQWARSRNDPRDFLLVRYEDIHADPERELRRILEFLGLGNLDRRIVREAVEANVFDRMRQREATMEVESARFRPADAADPESYKTRKGKVAGFFEYLDRDDIEAMTLRIEERLDPSYGYPLPTAPETHAALEDAVAVG